MHIQLSFCVFFLSPILWQFSDNNFFFQKKGFFCVFLFFFFFFVLFLCFFGGFKGHVRCGPPHLALNSPYLVFVLFFFWFFCCFFGGFKGQVRWPDGPKPSLFVFFVCFLLVFFFFFGFISFLCLIEKNLVFPQKKGIFLLFSQCFPFFLPSFF